METLIQNLTGKVALVTGGTRGIGLAIARSLHQAGATVVIASRTKANDETLPGFGAERISSRIHDVSDSLSASNLIKSICDIEGSVDILVNNAGLHLKKPAEETRAVDFESLFQTHIIGAHALARSVMPYMRDRGGGSILFIASMASLIGLPYLAAYSAAKSGVTGLVRSLAVEWAHFGIRVNGIAPGWIETPMMHAALDSDPERAKKILQRTPLKRFGQPDEVASAACFLCSQEAGFITGAILPVDGGASIGF